MTGNILTERSDHVLTLRINRLEKKNAFTSAMYETMASAILAAEDDFATRVIVLLGSEDCFTAGNDLLDFLQNPPSGESDPAYRFILSLANSTVPMVAGASGVAIGIGTTMLLHCDMVYATPDTHFQVPFVNLGLVPEAGSSYLLPKLVGHAKAAELLMSGKPFDGKTAHELGLVNELCSADDIEAKALAAAGSLAHQPPEALRQTKALLKSDRHRVVEQIHAEMKQFAVRLTSTESKEAFTAFKEKRPPDFSKIS